MLAALAPFVVFGLCAVPWVLLITPRYGARLAVVTVVTAAPLLVLAALTLSGALQVSPIVTVLVLSAVVGGLGGVLLRRSRPRLPTVTRSLPWLAAGLGGVVWLVVVAVAYLVPGADPLSWAMSGDGANNIHHARFHLADDGILADRGITVPLVSALLAVAISIGRPDSGASAMLANDLVGLSTLFALGLAVTSTLIGVVASSLVSRGRALLAAGASLLGATWLVAGLPIESGYLNGPISISLLLLAWLAFLEARRAPVYSLALQLAISILVMTTWTPLVLVSVALLFVTLMRSWVVVRVLRGSAAVPIVAAVIVIVAVTAVTLAPAFVNNSSVFATEGHGFPPTIGILAAAAAVALVLAVVRRREQPGLLDGAVALVVASIAGMAALLGLASQNPDPFGSYYPAKIGWMLAVLLSVVALSLALAAVNRRVAVVVIAATIGAASLGPVPAREYNPVAPPLVRILAGGVWHAGDHSARLIIDNVGENTILYRSGEPDEAFINFWLLEFGKGAMDGDGALRGFSFAGYRELRDTGSSQPVTLEELCSLLPLLEPDAVVLTGDHTVREQIATACDASDTTVRVLPG